MFASINPETQTKCCIQSQYTPILQAVRRAARMAAHGEPVPVTMLSGFLGSGDSTLSTYHGAHHNPAEYTQHLSQ